MARIDGTASSDIDAPIDRVWALLKDVERAPEWQSGLTRFDSVERDQHGRAVLCRSESDAKIRKIKSLVRVSYDEPHRLIWRQESSEDLKAAAGHWQLEDLGEARTRATYFIEVEVGGLLATAARGPSLSMFRELLIGGRPDELKRAIESAA